jgi:hypothetical protein
LTTAYREREYRTPTGERRESVVTKKIRRFAAFTWTDGGKADAGSIGISRVQ